MGSQALSVPKNVIFVAKNTYKNSAVNYGLSDLVYFPEDIAKIIEKNYNKKPSDGFYHILGIPKDSIKVFTHAILGTVEKNN